MASILKVSNFDMTALSVSEMTKNKQGNNTAYLSTPTSKKIIIQSPQMLSPFGLSEYPTESGVKYSLDLSFGEMSDPKVREFYEMCKKLDEYMINKAIENSVKWFGKQMTKEVLEEFYRPIVKKGKAKNSIESYPDTVKFKIRNINMNIYDDNKNKVNTDDSIEAGSRVRSIFEISPVWFVNKTFGITFNAVQFEVSKPSRITGYCFDDSDEE
tara:strand:+ start:430 stop:1068 length:639 start_codon:yes stop_codon:yes gene_type:complete